MSKEELERASAQGLSSSVPPRRTSDAPATLPSTPPSTDEIDTDWGADDSSEVTRVMLQPMVIPAAALAEPSERPTSPNASVAPPEPSASEPPPSPTASPLPAPSAEREVSPRPMRARSHTLIGLPPPTPPATLARDSSPPPAKRDSAPPPMPSAAFSSPPVRPPSAPPPPFAAPSAPPPPSAAPSSPPTAVPSSPPPPVAAPSTPPAPSVAPPAPGSLPAPQIAASPADGAAKPSGFGRWLLVLAAGLVVVSVLGYRVLRRHRAELLVAEVTTNAAEPASTAPATATAVAEPALVPSAEPTAATSASAAAAAEPAPALSASAASAPEPTASASAAPDAAPVGEIRKITVKSRPAKVRFFHYGKQVGVTPFVLEFKPGERHAYEAGLPGYGTRRVVIDGSKPEIIIGLQREKP